MPRITTKLFTDLSIWMIGLGFLTGASFPFLILGLGFEARQVLTLPFWMATLSAGILVGALNYLLALRVVRPRLRLLAMHMHVVESTIRNATYSGDWSSCEPEKCRVPVDSDDEIGDSARAFNDLVEALFRSQELEAAVSDISQTLSSQLDLDALSKQALELLLRHTGTPAGVILIERGGALKIAARHGVSQAESLEHSDHVRRAMRTGKIQRVECPEGVKIEAVLTHFRPQEVMVTPINFKDTLLGVVILAHSQRFSPEHLWLMELFRQGFGLALNNALAHANLQQIAALDALTGMYNRRFGMTRLHEEFNRSQRTQTPLGVVMMDIDYFKSINDNYGHLIGDRVLSQVAHTVRRVLREEDLMVRYGGEEFLFILPAANLTESGKIAERMRQLLAEMEIQDGETRICFTASFGVTAYTGATISQVEQLLKQADDALYRAKQAGRNQVVRHQGGANT